MLKIKNHKPTLIAIGLAICILFCMAYIHLYQSRYQKIVLSIKCFNKSFEERYRIYSSTLDEKPYNFYQQMIAKNEMVDMGDEVIPLIIDDLTLEELGSDKKRALMNIIGNISPDLYCDIIAGPPFSEIMIAPRLTKQLIEISVLKEASVKFDRSRQILGVIRSFGDDYNSYYEDYKVFCESQTGKVIED